MSGGVREANGQQWQSSGAIIVLACWFAIVSGLGLVFATLAARHFLGELITLGPNLLWMIPAAMLLVLCPLALVFVTVRAVATGPRRHELWMVWSFGFLAILNLEMLVPHMHFAADILIAAGASAGSTRWVGRHRAFFAAVVRRTTPPLVLLVFGAIGWTVGRDWWRERREVANLVPVSPGERPRNVVLIVLDTVRGISSSLNGYHRRTMPELERWAQRSIVFTHAIAPSAWTLPSHSTMFTGVWPDELGVDWEIPLQPSALTLAELLEGQGYLTAGFVANPTYTGRDFGLGQGFQHYEDYPVTLGEILVNAKLTRDFLNCPPVRKAWNYHNFLGRKSAQEVVEGALAWIAGRDTSRPFFAFLNIFDAHEPYLPPPEYARLYQAPGTRDLSKLQHLLHEADRRDKKLMSPEEIQLDLNAYEASINYADHWLGRFLDSLDAAGLLSSTLVIVTSDHGEQFGEHRKFGHGNTLYRELLEVPLLVILPRQSHGGTRVSSVVSLRDLPATILDVLGSKLALPGHTLARCWNENRCDGSPAFSAMRLEDKSWARSLVTDSLHFILWQKTSMTFAWRTDQSETTDITDRLATGAAATAVSEAMAASVPGSGNTRNQ